MTQSQSGSIPRKNKQRILLVELEFPTWNKARSWSYSAQLGYEEGLTRNDVSYMTIPAYWGISSSSPRSWLRHIKSIFGSQSFDQVWLEIVHSSYEPEFLSWLTQVAPVRVGFIPESLEYSESVYTFAPYLRNRKTEVEENIPYLTHVVAADEVDVEYFNQRDLVKATWWPAAVPQRCISGQFTHRPDKPASFSGELYGERAHWLTRRDLSSLLTMLPSSEIGTPYPKRFDDLNRETHTLLRKGKLIQKHHLEEYLGKLRMIRQKCFDLWLNGLQYGCSVVNLPHFLSTYPGRVVEAMSVGVPVISWEIPDRPKTQSLFRDGEEILLFSQDDPEQLVNHIRNIQKDREFARHLASNAMKAVQESHTIEKRVQEILEWIDKTKSQTGTTQEKQPHEIAASLWNATDNGNGHPAVTIPGIEESEPEPIGLEHQGTSIEATAAPAVNDLNRIMQYHLEAVKANPNDVEAWFELGKFAIDIDDSAAVKTAFQRALTLAPQREDIRDVILEYMPDVELSPIQITPENESDAYYMNLFGRDPEWSTPNPNQDEAARWAEIVAFLRRISSASRGKNGVALRILDLGCGRGWLTNLASEFGTCEGVDPVAGVVEMARKHFPGLKFYAGTAQTVRDHADFQAYDVVITSEVIEHIPDEEKETFIDDVLNLLTPDGHIILSTPRREIWEQWIQISNPAQPVEDWLREKDVRKLMTKKEFKVVGRKRVYQDITTRRFITDLDRLNKPDNNMLALYQVWAFQARGVGKGVIQDLHQTGAQTVPADENPVAEAPSVSSTDGSVSVPVPFEPPTSNIVAMISAYNEGDIIYHVIGDLIRNGVNVYFIDNNSTDDTVEQAQKWLGRGLLHIEQFPQDSGYPERNVSEYVWRDILKRKEEIASELGADWYIHADADEFRESPWSDLSLSDAIHYVDSLGYNAINFELLNFRPIDDGFEPGTDVRQHMPYFEYGELFNATQIKAWKHSGQSVQLAEHGGHAVVFQDRKICPIPFIVRHYPIRGEAHGKRKVFEERKPRFAKEERAMQWHVQYDDYLNGGKKFLYNPASSIKYEPDAVRASVLSRVSRDILLMETLHGTAASLRDTSLNGKAVCEWIGKNQELSGPAELADVVQANEALDKFLRLPLEKQMSADIKEETIPLILAMARIKTAQATVHGNILTARRLMDFCETLQHKN